MADPLLTDNSIQWESATPAAIQTNSGVNAWNAGHINDILKVGTQPHPNAIVASDTSGVWWLEWGSNFTEAIPISRGWGSINMTSLARGPDGPLHVYAGTYCCSPGGSDSVLWEYDNSRPAFPPFTGNWVPHSVPRCSTVEHILVIEVFRRIVVACDSGVFWSPIPFTPIAQRSYNWHPAMPGPGLTADALSQHIGITSPVYGNPATAAKPGIP